MGGKTSHASRQVQRLPELQLPRGFAATAQLEGRSPLHSKDAGVHLASGGSVSLPHLPSSASVLGSGQDQPQQEWRRRLDPTSSAQLAAVCLARYLREQPELRGSTRELSSTLLPHDDEALSSGIEADNADDAQQQNGDSSVSSYASSSRADRGLRKRMTQALPDAQPQGESSTADAQPGRSFSRSNTQTSKASRIRWDEDSSGSFGSFEGHGLRQNRGESRIGSRHNSFFLARAEDWGYMNTAEKWHKWCKETEDFKHLKKRAAPWAVDKGLGKLRGKLEDRRSNERARMREIVKLGIHKTEAGLRFAAPHLPKKLSEDAVEKFRHDELENVDRRSRRIRKVLSEVARNRHEAHRCIEVMQKTIDTSLSSPHRLSLWHTFSGIRQRGALTQSLEDSDDEARAQ